MVTVCELSQLAQKIQGRNKKLDYASVVVLMINSV